MFCSGGKKTKAEGFRSLDEKIVERTCSTRVVYSSARTGGGFQISVLIAVSSGKQTLDSRARMFTVAW